MNERRTQYFFTQETDSRGRVNTESLKMDEIKEADYSKLKLAGSILSKLRETLQESSEEMRKAVTTLRSRYLEKRLKLAKYYDLPKEGKIPNHIARKAKDKNTGLTNFKKEISKTRNEMHEEYDLCEHLMPWRSPHFFIAHHWINDAFERMGLWPQKRSEGTCWDRVNNLARTESNRHATTTKNEHSNDSTGTRD